MFIRVKSRKNSSGKTLKYAYLVLTKRRKKSKKSPKQKIIAYLGSVVELKNKTQGLEKPVKTMQEAIKMMYYDLLSFNDFKQKGNMFLKNEIIVDFKKKQVKDQIKGKKICLKVNDGFITEYTLKKLLNYLPPQKTEKEIGKNLAENLILGGFKPSDALFLEIFRSVSKEFHRK